VHFYDVGQALAALVELPDDKVVLVDTGDSRNPKGVRHLVDALTRDLRGRAIDVLWITHQHADHIGGAVEVLTRFRVEHYVDNGTPGKTKTKKAIKEVHETRATARRRHTDVAVADLAHRDPPLPHSELYAIAPLVPTAWGASCASNPNDCSIGLRIDFCKSSVMFTGDAEAAEENKLPLGAPVTLLQLGHHGSRTSSSQAFLARAQPKYAVISAGRPNQGLNTTYCHPAEQTVARVSALLGEIDEGRHIDGFFGARCKAADRLKWRPVRASRRLFATQVDGDVILETTGDGTFVSVNTTASLRRRSEGFSTGSESGARGASSAGILAVFRAAQRRGRRS
jgi:competence protein ComEC